MLGKPQSKVEMVRDELNEVVERVQDALGHLPLDKLPLDKAKAVSEAVSERVHEKLSHLPVDQAVDRLKDASGRVSEQVHEKLGHAPQTAQASVETARKFIAERLHDLHEALGHLPVERLEDLKHNLHHVSEIVAGRASSAAAMAGSAAGLALEAARQREAELAHRLRREASALPAARPTEAAPITIVTEDSSAKWLWLGAGLLVGVAIGLLLAPATGRRSRALLRDKAVKAGHEVSELGVAAVGKAGDLGRRATGLVHKAKGLSAEDDADDTIIADRVRTMLGENPLTASLERFNVDCVDGVVTLRGPMVGEAQRIAIEALVRGVKGVRDVRNELLTEDAPEDSVAFVG
jgi:BON domain